MMNKNNRKYNFESKKHFIENLYWNKNKSLTYISNIFGCDRGTLTSFMKRENIKIKSVKELHKYYDLIKKRKEQIKKKDLIKLFFNKGKSFTEIGKIFNFGRQAISELFKKYNIHITNEEKYGRYIKISEKELSERENYYFKVRRITKRNKKKLLKNWDGYDYYDKEYIKNNFKLNYNDKRYPTIDHKIPKNYGFLNNISPEIIGGIDNLCFTKRIINIKKNSHDIK